MNLSDSFKYLCYGSTATINIVILTVPGSTLDVRIYRRRILTTKVDPRATSELCFNAIFSIVGKFHSQGTSKCFILIKIRNPFIALFFYEHCPNKCEFAYW